MKTTSQKNEDLKKLKKEDNLKEDKIRPKKPNNLNWLWHNSKLT